MLVVVQHSGHGGRAVLEGLLVVVALAATVIVGTTIGRRYSVAPPVLLIVMGGLLALIPQLSDVQLPASAVLVIFLPGILYWESLNTSLREIRANIRVILLSAIGLVAISAVGECLSSMCHPWVKIVQLRTVVDHDSVANRFSH